MLSKYYTLRAGEDAATLVLYGDIAAHDPERDWDEAPYNLASEILALEAKVIEVYIDCRGGELAEGWAIYNALRQHPAFIKTHGMGFVASAALYPFMAGDERNALSTSAYYFHGVQSEDSEDAAKLTEIGRTAFTDNASVTDDDIAALQQAEQWISAQEMYDLGLATALISAPQTVNTQSASGDIIKRLLQKHLAPPAEEAPPSAPPPAEPAQKQTRKYFHRGG